MTHGKRTDQNSHTAESGPSSAQRPQLVILAAGLGQRFGGEKSLSGVGPHGESLLEFAIHDACCAGFGSFLLVIREDIATDTKAKILSRLPDDLQIGFAYQSADQCPANVPRRKKPWGTGHALLQTNSKIRDSFCVINADDYYGASSFGHMIKHLHTRRIGNKESATLGYKLASTLSTFGGVNRGLCRVDDQNNLIDIDETFDLKTIDGKIFGRRSLASQLIEIDPNEYVSMNFWALDKKIFPSLQELWNQFIASSANWPTGEFMLPNAICQLIKHGGQIVKLLPTEAEWMGVTYAQDLPQVQQAIREKIDKGDYSTPLF